MYPFIRITKDILMARRQPPMKVGDVHVSHHICWPWDLDMFGEMNNGRMLTLYDLGRFAMAQRGGLIAALFREKWTLTIAGSVVRYRRRITGFERFSVRSRVLCWDERFMYLEQSMWKRDGQCASHVVYRTAALEKGKMISPARIAEALNTSGTSPRMPEWVEKWVEAEDQRPWPPMQDAVLG
jgi:acyl-CoA thioesterase FadM